MNSTKENGNGKHKAETFIPYDSNEFASYYDIARDRCYYDVNGELLLIIDPQQIKKIKSDYLRQKNLKLIGIGLATIFGGIALIAISSYIKNKQDDFNGLIQEF